MLAKYYLRGVLRAVGELGIQYVVQQLGVRLPYNTYDNVRLSAKPTAPAAAQSSEDTVLEWWFYRHRLHAVKGTDP